MLSVRKNVFRLFVLTSAVVIKPIKNSRPTSDEITDLAAQPGCLP